MSVKISSLNTASTINSGDDINIAGNNPLTFSDWGGGWFMQDGTYIRSLNQKSIWLGDGVLASNGGLSVGYGGTLPTAGYAIIAGALLIGTTSTTNTAAGKIVNRLGGTSNPDLVLNGGAWSISSIGAEPALYLSSNIVAATGLPSATQTAKGGMGFEYSSATSPTDLVLGIFGSPTVASSVKIFNSTERLRIASNGNITLFSDAILLEGGTNTQLAIKDGTYSGVFSPSFNSLSDNILRFRNYDSVERMRITAAGLVGIGTSTPKSILEIVGNLSVTHTNGSSGYSEVLFYENNTLQADIFVNGTSNTNYAGANSMNIWQGSNAPIAFYTNGTNERMRIAAGGNLYIGHTDDYGARLSVKQPSSGNAANFSNGVDADLTIEITATGAATKYAKLTPSVGIPLVLSTTTGSNVLIGTTTDSGYKLYVNGTGRFSNDLVAVNGTTDSLYSRITSPGGGTSLGNAPIASAIKIALPADGSFLNTMISFTIHIYNYSAGTSRTIKVGGYSYFDTSWYNTFTYQSGGSQIDDINIRFGTEGGCACVWIGETTTYWHYPNIFITDVQVGHSQSSNLTKGWNVSLVSSFGSVQSTIVSYENITTYTIGSQSVSYATTAGALTSMLISQFTNDAGYITSGVSGSGTTDYLPKWTGASDLGDSIISEGSGIINVAGNVRTNNTNGILTLSNGNTSGGNKIQSWNTASNADGYLAFEGYTIEYGRFDASGQLGIGTTTPVTALDVVGGAYTNTTAKFGNTKPIYIINDDPHIGFNTYYNSGWKYGAGSSGSFAGTLGCAQTTGDFTLQTSTAGGNAGNAVTLVALMTWKQNGYVGIGTASPGAKLEIEAATAGYASIIRNTTAGGDYLKMIGDSGNTVFEFGSGGTGGDGFLNIYSDNSQKVLINADGTSYFNGGNVSIGTTSPSAPLTVAGTTDLAWAASTSKLQISRNSTVARLQNYENGSASTNLALQWEGGNVGIGTTNPEFLLDVAGGNARINGVMVGKGSNSVSTNLAVGVNPLYSNTSGSENTAIGYLTMYSTTTAIRNTALGNNALYSNTTGASNVAVGVGSLYSNTVGRYNSSVGYNSMQFMRGEYNSALGRDSMRGSLTAANNTGEYNTAVGYESMLLLTSGNWNTAVGNQAGTNLSTGSYNTFIGRSTVASAGGLVTTGSNNTIIGGYGGTTTLASTVVLADGTGQVQLWATGKNVALGTITPTTYANYTTLHIAGQTTTAGGVLRLTTSDSSTAVNIFTNNAGANYDTTTSHPHLFNINGATNLIVSSDGITTADPGNGAAAWLLGDVQNATVSLITSQYVEVVIGGSSYQLALVQLE